MKLTIFLALLACATPITIAQPLAEKPPQTKPARITYAGGDGSSFEKAVIIKGATELTGVRAEYDWVEKHHAGYKRRGQALTAKDGKRYDVLQITTKDGREIDVIFDITDFFRKF